jgi:hypothetical protein
MKSKTLAVFGIGTYILSVLSSATDLEGNSVTPIVLIAISGIATIVFYIMATIRLWKIQKIAPTLLIFSAVILVILPMAQGVAPFLLNIIKIINFIVFIWVISLLWAIAKHGGLVKKFQKDSGLTSEEISLVQEDLQKGDHEAAAQKIAKVQERHRKNFKEATGVDVKDIIPEIGKEISWADIVNHAFRVLEFDRNETTIDKNNQVKAKSSFKPYGYLLVESPILNNRVSLPIIHRDDFLLAASVFDEPELADLVVGEELLVTYAPKHLLPKGLSGSPHHVLHYVITPRGTLDSYYSMSNDIHMAKPDPQKLFGPFMYQGEIKVQINPEPEL